MPNYVYSTATCDNTFPLWKSDLGGANQILAEVTIKGGSNLADKKTFITQFGAATEISDNDLDILEQNDAFRRMAARGFFKIERSKRAEIESVVVDMTAEDDSAPLTDADVDGVATEAVAGETPAKARKNK